MKTQRGDQVYLKGYLASYSHSEGEFKRGTSTNRRDRGNRSCETIYVTDFQVLESGNQEWQVIYLLSRYLVLGALVFLIIL